MIPASPKKLINTIIITITIAFVGYSIYTTGYFDDAYTTDDVIYFDAEYLGRVSSARSGPYSKLKRLDTGEEITVSYFGFDDYASDELRGLHVGVVPRRGSHFFTLVSIKTNHQMLMETTQRINQLNSKSSDPMTLIWALAGIILFLVVDRLRKQKP